MAKSHLTINRLFGSWLYFEVYSAWNPVLDRLRSFINRVPRSGSRQPAHTSQSIFELIAVQVSLNPNSPIDEEAFPKIRLNEESDILMAAGVSDAVIAATSERGKDLKVVKEIVSESTEVKFQSGSGWKRGLAGSGQLTPLMPCWVISNGRVFRQEPPDCSGQWPSTARTMKLLNGALRWGV